MVKKFYDPVFAIATALLSLLFAPIWILMYGPLGGSVISIVLALAALLAMLWQSWKMAKEQPCSGS